MGENETNTENLLNQALSEIRTVRDDVNKIRTEINENKKNYREVFLLLLGLIVGSIVGIIGNLWATITFETFGRQLNDSDLAKLFCNSSIVLVVIIVIFVALIYYVYRKF
jgi:uncharacterized BrkB/YihY/UPF0761 family membrane protein